MENKYSLTEYASDKDRMAFVCTCKKCTAKMTDYMTPAQWLDIAFVLVQDDLLTVKEFKNLHHLAVSQWQLIKSTIKGAN